MIRVLGAAATGVALRLRAIEPTFSAQLHILAPFFGRRQTEFTIASSRCRTKTATGLRFVYLQAAGAPRAKCSSAPRGTLGAFGPM
jgi:hypothetical protein